MVGKRLKIGCVIESVCKTWIGRRTRWIFFSFFFFFKFDTSDLNHHFYFLTVASAWMLPSNPNNNHGHNHSLTRFFSHDQTHEPRFTYRGQRKKSYIVSDNAELVELRARLRTYDAGYSRATMFALGNSIVYLKLFDERFYRSKSDDHSLIP
jgi:hypothetical protein